MALIWIILKSYHRFLMISINLLCPYPLRPLRLVQLFLLSFCLVPSSRHCGYHVFYRFAFFVSISSRVFISSVQLLSALPSRDASSNSATMKDSSPLLWNLKCRVQSVRRFISEELNTNVTIERYLITSVKSLIWPSLGAAFAGLTCCHSFVFRALLS